MVLRPGIEFKAVERDALPADRNHRQGGPHGPVEAVPVHAEVGRGIAQPQEPRQAGLSRSHRWACELLRHRSVSRRSGRSKQLS